MASNDSSRWLTTVVAALAIVALLLFARGEPDHAPRDGSVAVPVQAQA